MKGALSMQARCVCNRGVIFHVGDSSAFPCSAGFADCFSGFSDFIHFFNYFWIQARGILLDYYSLQSSCGCLFLMVTQWV